MADEVKKEEAAQEPRQVFEPGERTSVRVRPANENMRKFLRHPLRNLGFGENLSDSVEWPVDQFTNRRIRDGDVVVVDDAEAADLRAAEQGERRAAAGETTEKYPPDSTTSSPRSPGAQNRPRRGEPMPQTDAAMERDRNKSE